MFRLQFFQTPLKVSTLCLLQSQVLDIVIVEYGWRLSYLFCAAVALQLCVCGSLLFPLPSSALESALEENDSLRKEENGRQADGDIENQHFEADSYENEDNLADHKTKTDLRRVLRRRASSGNKQLYYQKDLLNKYVFCKMPSFNTFQITGHVPKKVI